MKNKYSWLIIVVVCLILSPAALMYSAQATDVLSASVSVPVTTGLTGADNSVKTFYLDLPNGVSSSGLKTGTFKYSGNNSAVGSITIENGQIKITLKGNAQDQTYSVVGKNAVQTPKGIKAENIITNPGNSIWRYADGRRWQINDYKENKGTNVSFNANASDSKTPSDAPPITVVSTKSNPVDPSTVTWFKEDETTKVAYSSVIQSSIKLNPLNLDGDKGSIAVKDGQFVITYTVPSNNKRPEEVSDSFGKGQWVEGRLYYVKLPYYFTGQAKVTSYSYAGKVTFNYSLPTEANLTGNVTILKPNPNPTKFEGKDIAVELSVKGILAAYSDTSNISEWVFSAKEKGIDSTLQTKKDYTKTLISNKQFDFTIPKAKITSDNYRQEYTLTVTVRFKKPVLTSEGTTDSLTQTFGATVGVGIIPGQTDPPTVTPPPGPTATPSPAKKPPVAVLIAPNTVKAGEEFTLSGGGSYDPDGKIVEYIWDTPGIGDVVIGSSGTTWYSNSNLGENDVGLTVVDNDGITGSTGGFIEVIEPLPVASLKISGTKKQNRKVLLTNTSSSPKHYPLVDELTKITISAVSGGKSSDIKYSGSLNGVKEKDLLFKQPGTYKATVSVENTLGYKATNSITFEIVPDDPPVVYFSMPGAAYRDPTNGNKACISIDDLSFSPDNDLIARRVWEYRYDSDNDGSFEDESWVTFSDANLDRLNLVVLQVGRYEIRHNVYEEFGQPTIDAFVTAGDRRSADSSTQSSIEKIVDVKNRGPEVDWSW